MLTNYSKRAIRNFAQWTTFLLLLCSLNGFSQTYYPRADGNWNAGATWSTVVCNGQQASSWPTTIANNVSLSCARTVTVASSTSNGGALTIAGGTLIINSGTTLNVTSLTMLGGTLTVNGTLNIIGGGTGSLAISGGSVGGTGTIGLTAGAQQLSSTTAIPNLNIAGSGNKTMASSIIVTGRLTLTNNNLIVGGNTLTVGSSAAGTSGIVPGNGKLTLSSTSNLTFGGTWTNTDISTIISNTWPLTINNFTMTRNSCNLGLGTNHNLTVNGGFNLTAGEFAIGSSTLTLNGIITGNINGQVTGGPNSNLTIGEASVAAQMYFDLSNTDPGGTNTIRNFTNNRTNSSPFTMLSSLRIGGTLTEVANASLQISNGSIQTLSIDGTVSGTAKLVGNSAAILHINGSGALGGTLTFASSPQLASFTMNRIGGSATIGSALSIGGMTLKFGVLTNSFGTTITGSAPNNVIQEVSSSYINGPLSRTIAANTNAAAYIWPIGAAASQKLAFNGITTGSSGNVVIRAEAFDGNSGGTTDATISGLRTDNYWNASVTANASNLTAVGSVSLNDSGLLATNAIGYAASADGVYTSLGGSIASGAITSTLESPVALGFYNIGTGESVCADPTAATINATATTNCGTAATTLSIATGTLNSATQWTWYSGSCGGTAVGTGNSIVVSPAATTTYFVRGEGGCITPGDCASVTITVNVPQIWYADADGDSYGNPNATQLACSQPNNYVSNNADCDDTNNATHQTFSFYVDNDGDHFGIGDLVPACAIDANTPPAGFSANNTDCNDGDNTVYQSALLYADGDHDGYTSGVTQTVCYGAILPSGYVASLTAIDCNDSVGAIHPNAVEIPYNGVDDDCDNIIDETGTVTTTLLASSCGVTLASLQSLIGIQTLGGHPITGYRIRATNGAQVQTIETNVPHFTMAQFASYAYATTYTIDIQLQRAGLWQASWGTTCFVSTPAILQAGGSAAVNPSQCGITLTKINTLIATTSLAGVTGYRFRVTNITDPFGPNAVQTIDRVQNWFSLQMLTRYNYGTLYRIEVAVKTTGTYGGYGAACEITSPEIPPMLNCGLAVNATTTPVAVTSTVGAIQYRFQITRTLDNAASTIDRSTNFFTFNMVPAGIYTPGALYNVRVAIMTTGSWSPFGDVCELTAPGGTGKFAPTTSVLETVAFKANVAPNPFSAAFGIEVQTPSAETVQLKVYDMLGRLVESKTAAASELNQSQLGQDYPSGVYQIVVSQGDEVQTLRVIKR